MFLPHGRDIKGIETRIILNNSGYSSEHIVTLLEIARTYYQCTTIRLDVSGYQVSAEDALVILDTMDLFRTQYGVSFHTEASKTISFPGAYIFIFGDIGHRTLHANANIVRQRCQSIGFVRSSEPGLSSEEKLLTEIVSTYIKHNAYQRGHYDKIFKRLTGFSSIMTAEKACECKFADTVLSFGEQPGEPQTMHPLTQGVCL
jgi:ATP-dependent protease ClpP protease subunit